MKSSRLAWCDMGDPMCDHYQEDIPKLAKLKPVADPISTPNAQKGIKLTDCDMSDPSCEDYKTNGRKIAGTIIGNGYLMAGDLPIEELPGETQV